MPSITTEGAVQALSINAEADYIILLTIEHEDIPTARFTNNLSNVVSRGDNYIGYPFELEMMRNSEGVPNGRIRIANVSRFIWRMVETLIVSPTFTFEIVLSTDLDTPVDSFEVAELLAVSADVSAVEGALTHERYAVEPWPAPRLTPQYFPWLSR